MTTEGTIRIVYGERMIDCPECGRQYVDEQGRCILCESGGPETVAEEAVR